jgi:hypothetical protein
MTIKTHKKNDLKIIWFTTTFIVILPECKKGRVFAVGT